MSPITLTFSDARELNDFITKRDSPMLQSGPASDTAALIAGLRKHTQDNWVGDPSIRGGDACRPTIAYPPVAPVWLARCIPAEALSTSHVVDFPTRAAMGRHSDPCPHFTPRGPQTLCAGKGHGPSAPTRAVQPDFDAISKMAGELGRRPAPAALSKQPAVEEEECAKDVRVLFMLKYLADKGPSNGISIGRGALTSRVLYDDLKACLGKRATAPRRVPRLVACRKWTLNRVNGDSMLKDGLITQGRVYVRGKARGQMTYTITPQGLDHLKILSGLMASER